MEKNSSLILGALLGAGLGIGGMGLLGKRMLNSPRMGKSIGKFIESTRFGKGLTSALPSVARGKVLESQLMLSKMNNVAPWLAAGSAVPLMVYLKHNEALQTKEEEDRRRDRERLLIERVRNVNQPKTAL